jgi:hypothetical protein
MKKDTLWVNNQPERIKFIRTLLRINVVKRQRKDICD